MEKLTDVCFPDELVLKNKGIVNGTRVFEVQSDFRFISSLGIITAKKGFLTDGYSVPPFLHSFCNPLSKGMESSVLHDVNYSKNCPNQFDRKTCDLIFLEGMEICGVGLVKRNLIYSMVRSFGWRYYRKK